MRATTLTSALLVILATSVAGQTPRPAGAAGSTLEGVVRGSFEGTSDLLAHALVEARGGSFARAAVADSLGRYSIAGLPAGELSVRVTHPGHETLTLRVLVPPDGTVRVDLLLRAAPVELAPVEVVRLADAGPTGPAEDRPSPSEAEVELQALELTPGIGQPGLLEAVRALPGNDPADPTDVLFMRGSSTDLKLVLLDGVPVYTPFHVAGLLRSFEPSVLGRADLHVGGAPARYDGGLTHILDLGTRRARRDRVRGSGSVDLLSATAALEGPVGPRAGLVFSGRSLHDLGSAPLGGARPYGYHDLLFAFDAEPAREHALRATGFWNRESVRLDFDPGPGDAVWSNRAASLAYRTRVGEARLEITAGASGYRAELPLQPSADPGEPVPPPLLASAAVDRVRVVAEVLTGSEEHPLRLGASFDGVDAAFDARSASASSASRAATSTPGLFVDAMHPLGRGVTLRAGLRGDLFAVREARLAPRLALHWEVGPEALLTVAAGRYHQPTRAPDFEIERTLAEVAEDGVDPAGLLPVATADHVVLSLDQRLGGRVSLGLEGFWKRFEGLESGAGETIRSSGIDVRVMTSGEPGVVWLGYGLSWFWSSVDLSGYAADFAGRHLLSAGVSGRLAGPFRGEARLAYGAGLPYTSIPFRGGVSELDASGPQNPADGDAVVAPEPAPIVGGLDEEFLRIDVELHALWETEWGGRPWQVRPYVRVLNALDRRDALFFTFQPWRPESVRPLAERPFLPLFGVAVTF